MSKLTDIKRRLDELDGGTFQNLCDAYLICRGYGNPYSLGMLAGTSKTTTGNPDTYFMTDSGKYVFVMYTTQKQNFLCKALDDLRKCFDPTITGLQPVYISEIVYCHTYGRLSAGDSQQLYQYCEQHDTSLSLVGLDKLGSDLYLEYPRLAKDFLGISVDTGQITNLKEFVTIHDVNKLSAPLKTEFLFREEELKSAKEKLSQSDVLIISGAAGVGKTRLALQLCDDFASENGYEVLCIKCNGLEIYEDLNSRIETCKDYLVFVDDANELTGLHLVLSFLSVAENSRRTIKKLVVTVRDYARQQVANIINKCEKAEVIRVDVLRDEEIRKLLKDVYAITNYKYTDRIVSIAEGNARLAMLAGKIAVEHENLYSIHDATELYEHYYGEQIESIAFSEVGIASAGILAFFSALHLDNLDALKPIFESANISEDQFMTELRRFHALDLVDLCHDKAAKISDQSFRNYLIKYTFVDRKIVPLHKMLEECFFISEVNTIDVCNILFDRFPSKAVQDYVKEQLEVVWYHLRQDERKFESFFRAFYMIRPTKSLVIIKGLIDAAQSCEYDVQSAEFNKEDCEKNITDNIIEMLCGYKYATQLPEAIALLLLYYRKRSDLFEQVFSALAFRLGVDIVSSENMYYPQVVVVESLCNEVKKNPTYENQILFVRVAEQFLKLNYSGIEGGRRHTYSWYTVSLTPCEQVYNYRKMLLRQLLDIYINEKCRSDIESLLMDYGNECEEKQRAIIKNEFNLLMPFLIHFSPENLYHCVLAEHIKKMAEWIEIDVGNYYAPFLSSHKYKIYYALSAEHSDIQSMDYYEHEAWHKEKVKRLVEDYSISDFQFLLQLCRECIETFDRQKYLLGQGLMYVFDSISGNKKLFVDAVNEYLRADTPYSLIPNSIVYILFKMIPVEDVKSIIELNTFSEKNTWLWAFYAEMPVESISATRTGELLKFFEVVPSDIHTAHNRRLGKIRKYECSDKNIVTKTSRTILAHYEESPFLFNLYFSSVMDLPSDEASSLIEELKKDISLMEEIYLKCVEYSALADREGRILADIISNDQKFLYRYLDELLEKHIHATHSAERWIERLGFVWICDTPLPYMDMISNYLYESTRNSPWVYSHIVGNMLLYKNGLPAIAEKQENWVFQTIEEHCQNNQRMHDLFAAIEKQSDVFRRKALGKILALNSDYELFEKLHLLPQSWSWSGSAIPAIQKRISYLASIVPMLSGVDYLSHRNNVEHCIEALESEMKREEIQELLES